jgi:hypothetical protein
MKTSVEIFGERLKTLVEGIETMKEFGLDESILVSWLVHRGKLSEKRAKELLKCQEEFYNKLIKKSILEKIKDE